MWLNYNIITKAGNNSNVISFPRRIASFAHTSSPGNDIYLNHDRQYTYSNGGIRYGAGKDNFGARPALYS